MTERALFPVGKRPRCLCCNKELRPNFKWIERPWGLSKEALQQWKRDHPRQFLGTYGGYRDNRFCGLGCGYSFAIHNTREAI